MAPLILTPAEAAALKSFDTTLETALSSGTTDSGHTFDRAAMEKYVELRTVIPGEDATLSVKQTFELIIASLMKTINDPALNWITIGGGGTPVPGPPGPPGVPTALVAVGSSPNANAATLSGSTLNLEPADSTHPGVLTAIAQDIGGVKTFKTTVPAVSGNKTMSFVNNGAEYASITMDATYNEPRLTIPLPASTVPALKIGTGYIARYGGGSTIFQFGSTPAGNDAILYASEYWCGGGYTSYDGQGGHFGSVYVGGLSSSGGYGGGSSNGITIFSEGSTGGALGRGVMVGVGAAAPDPAYPIFSIGYHLENYCGYPAAVAVTTPTFIMQATTGGTTLSTPFTLSNAGVNNLTLSGTSPQLRFNAGNNVSFFNDTFDAITSPAVAAWTFYTSTTLTAGDLLFSVQDHSNNIRFGVNQEGRLETSAVSGSAAVKLLDGARLNFSTADASAYMYRSSANTISAAGALTALGGAGSSAFYCAQGMFSGDTASIQVFAATGGSFASVGQATASLAAIYSTTPQLAFDSTRNRWVAHGNGADPLGGHAPLMREGETHGPFTSSGSIICQDLTTTGAGGVTVQTTGYITANHASVGLFSQGGGWIISGAGFPLHQESRMTDGATSQAHILNVNSAWSNAGARLVDVQNNGTRKFSIDTTGLAIAEAGGGFWTKTNDGIYLDNAGTKRLYYDGTYTRVNNSAKIDGSLNINTVGGAGSAEFRIGTGATATASAFFIQDATFHTFLQISDATGNVDMPYSASAGSLTATTGRVVSRNAGGGFSFGIAGTGYLDMPAGTNQVNYQSAAVNLAATSITSDGYYQSSTTGGAATAFYASGATSGAFQAANMVRLLSGATDGASAVAVAIDSSNTFANTGAKLLSIRNSAAEKAFWDKNGVSTSPGAIFTTGSITTPTGASTVAGTPLDITLGAGGAGSGAATGATGGALTITAGAGGVQGTGAGGIGGAGGKVTITAGAAGAAGGNIGGDLWLLSGAGGASDTSHASSAGGLVLIAGGTGGAGAAGGAGNPGGSVIISAGTGGSNDATNAGGGLGGDLVLKSGNGGPIGAGVTGREAGAVTLDTGFKTGSVGRSTITIGGTNAGNVLLGVVGQVFSISSIPSLPDYTDDSANTGSRTVNKTQGRSAFANGTQTITITNSLCTSNTTVYGVLLTNDGTTGALKCIIPTNGSFEIRLTSNASGPVVVAWYLLNHN